MLAIHPVHVANRDYESEILSESNYGGLPIACWDLRQANGTTITDLMTRARGSGFDLTFTPTSGGNPTGVTLNTQPSLLARGRDGHAVGNGSTGYAFRNDSVLGNSPPSFTLESIVLASAVSNRFFLALGRNGADPPTISLSMGDTGLAQSSSAVRFLIRDDANVIHIGGSGEAYGTAFDARKHHVAATYASGVARVYVDGLQVGSKSGLTPGAITLNRTAIFALLRTVMQVPFPGGQQYPAIYNYALAAERVHAHAFAALYGN